MGYIFEWIIAIIIIAVGLAAIIFHLKMMFEAFRSGDTGWGFLILFFSLFASGAYYFMKYKNRSPYEKRY